MDRPPGRTYVLASGSPQGVYFPLARDIAAVARRAGIDLRVVPSLGSRQNLAWLAAGQVDLGLAQSDTAFDAYRGRGGFTRPVTEIRAIAPLYTEAIHILVRKPLYLRRVEDLRGKRISIGPQGSGTEANAAEILEAAGLTLGEVAARRLGVEETLDALRRGELDAAFLTSGVPSAPVTRALTEGSVSLFEPDRDLVDRLQELCPFFLIKNIEPTDYPHVGEEVTTIGVKALLLGRSDLDEATVDRLVRAISSSQIPKKYHLPEATEAATGIAVPTFESARHFYAVQALLHRYLLALGILFAVMAGLTALYFRESLRRHFKHSRWVWGILYFGVLWLLGSFALYATEHRINDNYSTFWRSMWSGLITIYSLSNKEPLTLPGRVTAVLIFMLGVGGILWVTERIFSVYLERKILPLLRGGFSRIHKMKNHYVIVGWNKKGPGIIEQLHGEDLDDRKPVAILAEEGQARGYPSHGQVQVEHGDRASEAALRKVAVHAAHSVIVLADDADPAPDARTILTILAVRKICSEQTPPRQVPVIAEIVDSRNVSLANYAGVEGGGTLEIVSAAELGERLLTQAAVHPGLSNVYRSLLTFEKKNSEIHRSPMPAGFKTFEDLASWAVEQRSRGVNVIPIAIQRGGKLFINPSRNDLGELLEEDVLFALCDSPRDLRKLYHTATED